MRARILGSLCRLIIKVVILDAFYRAFIRSVARKMLDMKNG